MNHHVLRDFLRRKRWPLAIGAVLFFALNWLGARHGGKVWASSLQIFYFQLPLMAGPLLLSTELKRGYARVLHTLPMTAVEVGRAWWTATVLLTGLAVVGLTFAASGLVDLLSAEAVVDYGAAARRAALTVLLLGAAFGLFHTLPYRPGQGWRSLLTPLASVLGGILMVAGTLWNRAQAAHPLTIAAGIVVALALAWRGWARADASLQTLACLPAQPTHPWAGWSTRATTPPRPTSPACPRYPGLGGLTRWLLHSCAWVLLGIAGLTVIMFTVPLLIERRALHAILLDYTRYAPFWTMFIPLLALLPATSPLRVLRTLPVGPGRLAACLLGSIVLPLAIAALLLLAAAHWLHGPTIVAQVLPQLCYGVGAACLVAPFALWRGAGWLPYSLVMGAVFFGIYTFTFSRVFVARGAPAGWDWTPGFALVAISIGWLLTWLVLTGSRYVYQRAANPFMSWYSPPMR